MQSESKYTVSWSAPSNIALVKYWGKRPIQLPSNPSVSFTLTKSLTHFHVSAFEKTSSVIEVDFIFEGSSNQKFQEKIVKFLQTQSSFFPWLVDYKLTIQSSNTFPHSSGIASSASSMAALCLSLCSLHEAITGEKLPDFNQKASELARLASGSAGRSVYPFMASWGIVSEEFASPILKSEIHPDFHDFCDSILIVDAKEKSVSSRAGHSLMESHPFRESRFNLARNNCYRILAAMKAGDMQTFIEIVELEALMLHALMMTSTPSYILLKPDSLLLIEKIRAFRAEKNIPVCFTIDAGPNIHLLYPALYKNEVQTWCESLIPGMKIIHDQAGGYPERHQIHES